MINRSRSSIDSEEELSRHMFDCPGSSSYRTGQTSRQSSHSRRQRHGSTSPSPMRTSPSKCSGRSSPLKRMSRDGIIDESISILDPRRFTPTLHANLVAEILNLRRDLESKTHLIDTLEHDLSLSRSEAESNAFNAVSAFKEVRDTRRQLELLENEGAVDALSRERDDALGSLSEMKRQVERLTKSRRSVELDRERTHEDLDRQKQDWEHSKRALERRAHVAEGRLKALLDEIATANTLTEEEDYRTQLNLKDGDASDAGSVKRPASRTSLRPASVMIGDEEAERLGIRFSMINANFSNAHSLAEELDVFNEEDEYDSDKDSNLDITTRNSVSKHSSTSTVKALEAEAIFEALRADNLEQLQAKEAEVELIAEENKKLHVMLHDLEARVQSEHQLRLELEYNVQKQIEQSEEAIRGEKRVREEQAQIDREEREELELQHQRQMELLELLAAENQHQLELLAVERLANLQKEALAIKARNEAEVNNHVENVLQEIMDEVLQEEEQQAILEMTKLNFKRPDMEIASFLPKKAGRFSSSQPARLVSFIEDEFSDDEFPEEAAQIAQANERRKRVSKSFEPIIIAPKAISTGSQTTPPSPPRTPNPVHEPETVDMGCQTEDLHSPPRIPLPIPLIEVHPPLENVTKTAIVRDASCQTQLLPNTRTTSMQTEQITIDRRILPASLKNITLPTPNASSPPILPAKSEKRLVRTAIPRNVTAPVSSILTISQLQDTKEPRFPDRAVPNKSMIFKDFTRPPRTSSLFAGLDAQSDEDDDFQDPEFSDEDFTTILSAPRPPRPRNVNIQSATLTKKVLKRVPSLRKPLTTVALNRNNIATHTQKLRNPSVSTSNSGITSSSAAAGPPFAIPLRHSSKKLPPSLTSSRASSPTPLRPRDGGIRRSKPSVRKSQSARGELYRARSPPPMSISSTAPSMPEVPPLPQDTITHESTNKVSYESRHTGTASIDSSKEQSSVVDAIAQTMVGEWMWKYVRRRKSFGVSQEPPQAWDTKEEGSAGVRHKRWVWLAPYERAVMWSSRQPTSGTALLGKSGRKLPIQSVLDVKDDTPSPKGVPNGALFNRSILILTPARALKFTATSKERHYLWLTALSFLSQSSQGAYDSVALPPPLPFEIDHPSRQSSFPESVRNGKKKLFVLPSQESLTQYTASNVSSTYIGADNTASRGLELSNDSAGATPSHYGSFMSDETLADYPTVPRHGAHGRKRSNTAPRLPNPRSFSNNALSNTALPVDSFDNYSYGGLGTVNNYSETGSISYGPTGAVNGNFFEAVPVKVGTVRMEAFVETKPKYTLNKTDEFLRSPSTLQLRSPGQPRSGRSKGFVGYYGGPEQASISSYDDDYSLPRNDPFRNDPFRGF